MTKKKSTKRALISSLLILAMCFTMLAGTTFAWFTDSVTSTGNIIKSGKLDVSMKWANGTEDPAAANWTDASQGAIFNYDLWEPGYTEVRHIQIKNDGTLALKYKVQIVANGDVSALADVIDVYYADPAVQVADRNDLVPALKLGTLREALAGMSQTASGNLVAGAADTITIALKMQEEAGNEYQNMSIGTTFSIQVLAAQWTKETDAFDDQYDANAVWPVSTQEEFSAALTAAAASTEPATVVLSAGDYTIPAGTTIENLTIEGKEGTVVDTINISSAGSATIKNLTAENVTFESSNGDDWKGILTQETHIDNATFKNCEFSSKDDSGRTNGIYGPYTTGTLTFEDCTIYGDVYGINFSTIDTLVLRNCDISGWNTFGGDNTANVIIENCRFHKSGYNKLGFYTNATITDCVFDTNFFDANTGDYGNFTGGIDARRGDDLPITITLSGNTIKNVNTNATTPLAAANLLTANYAGGTKWCNATWILNGVDVTASVPKE